jgi:TatD DNase family protein
VGWTDSHCHVQYDGVGLEAVARARAAGVDRIVCVGTDAATSAAALELARGVPGLWATAGLHPHDASQGVATIEPLLTAQPGPVAVGECGLDYHYDHSPRDVQRAAFAAQVGLAHAHGLALVVHSRQAWDDTFAILDSEGVPARTVFHCFTGGPAEAEQCLARGGWLSFSGIVTFRNAEDVRSAAVACPLDRLLVETDAPFLAPAPHRGQTNEPAFVAVVGAAVASAKGLAPAEVERASAENATAVFGLGSVP